MADSLRDNVLVHLQNPDPTNRIWQMAVISGSLNYVNTRANEYGLSYVYFQSFVKESMASVEIIMDVVDPTGGYSQEVLQFTEDATRDFFCSY